MPMSQETPVDCRVITDAATDDIVRLYRDAGWWDDHYGEDFIPRMLRDSFCVVAAFDADGKMVGMGRAISDGCSDAYIQDIVVLREYRRGGIGGKIVATLLERLRAADIDWIGLVAAPGTEKFYHSIGFEPMRDYIPMIYKQENGDN